MRHYLMTTDQHFEAALLGPPKAAQNPAQQAAEESGNDMQAAPLAHKKTPGFPGSASACTVVQTSKVAGAGFEPTTSRL